MHGNGDIEKLLLMTNTIRFTFDKSIKEIRNYLKEKMDWFCFEESNDYPICKSLTDYDPSECKSSLKWFIGNKIDDDGWKRGKLMLPFLAKLIVEYILC